jgi:hypothetical protein
MATRKARHQNRPDASLAHRIAGENPRWFPVSMSHLDDLVLFDLGLPPEVIWPEIDALRD